MTKEKLPYEKIVSKIRFQKIATVTLFIVIAVFSLVLLGDFHYYNGIEDKGIGLSLHPLIVFAVIVGEGIVAVALYSRAENSVEPILYSNCDPQLYYQVRKALFPVHDRKTDLLITEVMTSYFLGDFAKCEKISAQLIELSGVQDKLFGLSYQGMSAFFLEDKKTLESSCRDFKRLLERSNLKERSPFRREMDRCLNILEMLNANEHNASENALLFANALYSEDESIPLIERLNLLYLRFVVYESFGEKRKASECVDKCRKIKNKTFIFDRINDQN